ncbi:hypothetical protein [Bifidobacterium sp.]|jgi:predicted oxidoreductase|uniref:hypothetical protein n=1 Tax=Bifidobacterium sp. TaxID=41200 RepID=UPI0025BD1E7E|nr:hypothetical protein [Bifidobacterium sp.]MCI1634682.1 hypothetical protein [Bifidobacterium sp.]
MRTVSFGSSGIQQPNIIGGMMRIAEQSDEEIRALYEAYRSVGVTYFDHSDLYGFNVPVAHICVNVDLLSLCN